MASSPKQLGQDRRGQDRKGQDRTGQGSTVCGQSGLVWLRSALFGPAWPRVELGSVRSRHRPRAEAEVAWGLALRLPDATTIKLERVPDIAAWRPRAGKRT